MAQRRYFTCTQKKVHVGVGLCNSRGGGMGKVMENMYVVFFLRFYITSAVKGKRER